MLRWTNYAWLLKVFLKFWKDQPPHHTNQNAKDRTPLSIRILQGRFRDGMPRTGIQFLYGVENRHGNGL